ncbi:MAG: hypothetical protein IH613_13515 [Desulfuromonadales bacterium]|nr:hypothetical protein [Desulfuromonadales bacterium]
MVKAKLLKNGRDKGTKGGLSQVKTEMQESAAFKSLNASSLRVLIYAIFLNYFEATRTTGQPVFKFTNNTARKILGMNQDTFTRAKKELAEKGFWKWARRGGLKGCNGIASEFVLSGDWKTWEADKKKQVRQT